MGIFKELRIEEDEKLINEIRAFRAVLVIFESDDNLKLKALPFINFEKQTIDWDSMEKNNTFSANQWAAVFWAKAIWHNYALTVRDPFDAAHEMRQSTQNAVLRALAIRWGLYENYFREAV